MKFYTLVAVLAAMTIAIGYFFPPLMIFLIIIIGLSLLLKQSIAYALVVWLVSYLLQSNPIVIINIVLLPLIVISLKLMEPVIFTGYLKKGCLSRTRKRNHLLFAIVSFLIVFISNMISELIYGIITQTILASLLAGIIPSIIGAIIVSILIGFIGIPLLKRLNKLYYKFEK